MNNYDYYLGHPFDSRKKVRRWELNFEKRTGIQLFNPFYDAVRNDVIAIDAGRKKRYSLNKKEKKDLVKGDIEKIKNAKIGMVAVIDGSLSYGTIQEMVYAKRVYRKKVFSLITNGHEGHPWLKFHSTSILTKLKDLENIIMGYSKITNPKNKEKIKRKEK